MESVKTFEVLTEPAKVGLEQAELAEAERRQTKAVEDDFCRGINMNVILR